MRPAMQLVSKHFPIDLGVAADLVFRSVVIALIVGILGAILIM